MDPKDLPSSGAPLTVNEQVIIMSGQETIRVLEVEVDAPAPSDGMAISGAEEGGNSAPAQPEASNTQKGSPNVPTSTGGGTDQVVCVGAASPPVQTLASAAPISVALTQPQATGLPITVQGCPQVLTQDGLATLMTGMMAQTGSLNQPLLIPLSMASSMGGQGGLAVFTFPTTNVASIPGLAAATNPAGNLLKLPFTGLQAATVLNSVQPQLQTAAQTLFQPQAAASLQSVQAAIQQVTAPATQATSAAQVTAAQMAAAQVASAMTTMAQPNLSVATLQTAAGLSINPAIITAASLGAQPQFISSTPIFTNAMSNMAGLTSQIITNAQGQVIGTIPVLLNPASLTGGAATQTLPYQGLQVQTISPQILLNAQGQIIATIGNGPTAVPTSAAVAPKAAAPVNLSKPTTQAPTTTVAQSPVVIAPQPPVMKTSTSISSVPIACAEMPTVGQLVSKPQQAVNSEEGINLEEIREFAKNFKIRRLSLGLTQTQVGQALTATEGPAYSQSAICRFEKLDITPKSAQKLKPVLERWLAEAEAWNQKGQQNLMEFVGGEPSKKRKRRTSFTPQAIEVLNTYFEKNALPTGQEITEIAKELNYDREVVRVWFCNRRQTLKNTSKINLFQVSI
ncbi:POU domain, class 6, transcription factor 1 [Aplochiton taeniatus]